MIKEIRILDRNVRKPGWYCTVCNRVFLYKEETEVHKHEEKTEGDK